MQPVEAVPEVGSIPSEAIFNYATVCMSDSNEVFRVEEEESGMRMVQHGT